MAPQPLFIEAPPPWDGARFAMLHEPPGPARGAIVYVHPLAEEMNKSRRMAAVQSRRLAAAGWVVLQIDLLGCGDSAGDFADASWDAWCADVRFAAAWLRERRGLAVWLWGLRAGALVAAAAAAETPDLAGLLLWQPVPSGKLAVQQFLRLKAAAGLIGGQPRGGSAELRRSLAAGEVVDIAGYGVRAALIEGLEQAALERCGSVPRIEWLELGGDEAVLAPASSRQVQAWREAGVAVRASVVRGPAFWQTTEIEDAPELWRATDEAMAA